MGRNEAVHVEITSCYAMLKDLDCSKTKRISERFKVRGDVCVTKYHSGCCVGRVG